MKFTPTFPIALFGGRRIPLCPLAYRSRQLYRVAYAGGALTFQYVAAENKPLEPG